MILNKLQSANSIIMDSVNASNNKHAAETFKNQLISLSVLTAQLEQLLNLIDYVQAKGITPSIMSPEIKESLQAAVDSCGEKTYSHALDAGTVAALKNAADLCRNAFNSIWKEAADKKCSSIIESLASLKSLLADVKDADKLIAALCTAKENAPSSKNDVDVFLDNIERGKHIIEGLHFDSDNEVKSFIEKVRMQKATVVNLTPHVLEWLKNNHLSDKIKLRF